MRWKRFAVALLDPDRLVEKKFGQSAGAEPREAAVVARVPESKSAITNQPVPPKKRRLDRNSGHGFDRIPRDFANVPKLDHFGFMIDKKARSASHDALLK